jgi:hypothetical protein
VIKPHNNNNPGRFAKSLRRAHLPMHQLDEDQFDARFHRMIAYCFTGAIMLAVGFYLAAKWCKELARG